MVRYQREPECPICHRRIYLGSEVISLRVGCKKLSEKPGRGHCFYPESFDDDEEEKHFHFDCFSDVFELSEAEGVQDFHCCFCNADLDEEPYFCEFGLAKIQRDQEGFFAEWKRDALDGSAVLSHICWECAFDGMEKAGSAKLILGMVDDEEFNQLQEQDEEVRESKRRFKPATKMQYYGR